MPDNEQEKNRDALMERAILDSAAFGTLYDMYYEKVFRYCVHRIRSRQIAEDITGAAFLYASQNISKFRGKTRTEFLDWLFIIATAKIKTVRKQSLQFQNISDTDNLPDIVHKEKLRSKILSSFNQPQPAEIPYRMLSFAVVVLAVIIAGVIIWLYPPNKPQPQNQPLPQTAAEPNIPQPLEKTRLEKIKQFAAEKNVTELLNVLRTDDLSGRLLAAKFLAEITGRNAADFLKIAVMSSEPNNANELGQNAAEKQTEKIIAITAIDRVSKKPIGGVEMEIQMQDNTTNVSLGEDGQYTLTIQDKLPDWFTLTAKKDGFAAMRFSRHGSAGHQITLPEKIVFAMSHTTSIGGFVENKLQKPVQDAEISVYAGYEFDANAPFVEAIENIHTDANGFWKCSTFPQDTSRAALIVKHADYAENETSLSAVEQLKSFSHLTVLEEGVDVSGMVSDAEHRPLPAVIIKGGSRKQSVKCDNAGKFQFDNIPAGTELFAVQCKGFAPQIQQINIEPNMPEIVFTLSSAGNIRARIVDIKNAPLNDVYVKLKSWHNTDIINFETHTDANGFFQWIDAPTDKAVFEFSKPGYISVDDFEMESENDYVISLIPQEIEQEE